MNRQTFLSYCYLARLHKPIGLFLLLWPTWWALWLAGEGKPSVFIVIIFTLGVIVMRSTGCVINDFADRYVDGKVARTAARPLVTGQVTPRAALVFFSIGMLCAFLLVLCLNLLTILLAFVGAALAVLYPFLKRITHLPQVGLGLAFAWGVPMAFAAETNHISASAWVLFAAAAVWPVMYDTLYAMVDRADDVLIGVKSTAILFGKYSHKMIGFLQLIVVSLLLIVGYLFRLKDIYFLSVLLVFLLFCYQQWLIKDAVPNNYFKAFLNNNWVGCIIFIGIFLSALQ